MKKAKGKIEWIGTAEALFYLIKKLKEKKYIKVRGKKQWEIFSDYFIIVENPNFDFNKLGKQHKPSNLKIIENIDLCIRRLDEG